MEGGGWWDAKKRKKKKIKREKSKSMGKEGARGGDVEEMEIKSGEHLERQSQAATEGRGDGEVGQEWGAGGHGG